MKGLVKLLDISNIIFVSIAPVAEGRGCSFVSHRFVRHQSSSAASATDNYDGGNSSDSLSHWLSSPERYAERLGLTVEQVQHKKETHRASSQALRERLSSISDGNRKHQLVCEHRYRNGKHPFVCQNCWSYLPICLCQEAASDCKISLPKTVRRVVLWTHHLEWGSVTNSGSLLPLMLEDTQLLMKGMPDHDKEMTAIGSTNESRVVVLWPDNNTGTSQQNGSEASSNRMTWQELKRMLKNDNVEEPPATITLVALEGTWRTARRMASKLPDHALRVALPPAVAFWHTDSDKPKSLLQPLRRQEGGSEGNICTAEAVAAALVGLGMPIGDGERILDLVQKKVDQTRRYQGKRTRQE